jgi:glycine cleavage system H lipoate-binding protein
MKSGAMDYVQKPFTEDELLAFVKKSLLKRQDRIQKQLKPKVHITHVSTLEGIGANEFAIPGGVFIDDGHAWASTFEDGTVRVGLDDFARRIIGPIDNIEFPNLGMTVQRGAPLFTVRQGQRIVPFTAPVSGKIIEVNTALGKHPEDLDATPYAEHWVCTLDADSLDKEIPALKIGKTAVAFFQEELERLAASTARMNRRNPDGSTTPIGGELYAGVMQDMDDRDFEQIVGEFFRR